MAKKPDFTLVYRVKWRDLSKIKKAWGPFSFDIKTGISVKSFHPWHKAIQNILHVSKYGAMFELLEFHEPYKCKVVPMVKNTEPIDITIRKLREEEFKAVVARIEKEELENFDDDLPDKIVEKFHKKEKKNKKSN